jgi:hypothetical protein
MSGGRNLWALLILSSLLVPTASAAPVKLFKQKLDVRVPYIKTDKLIKYDYDIVYVRAGRAGDEIHKGYYTDFSQPIRTRSGIRSTRRR